jgi:hypothetical protein
MRWLRPCVTLAARVRARQQSRQSCVRARRQPGHLGAAPAREDLCCTQGAGSRLYSETDASLARWQRGMAALFGWIESRTPVGEVADVIGAPPLAARTLLVCRAHCWLCSRPCMHGRGSKCGTGPVARLVRDTPRAERRAGGAAQSSRWRMSPSAACRPVRRPAGRLPCKRSPATTAHRGTVPHGAVRCRRRQAASEIDRPALRGAAGLSRAVPWRAGSGVRGARAAAVAAYFGIAAALWVSDSVHLATMLLELNALETVRLGPRLPLACGGAPPRSPRLAARGAAGGRALEQSARAAELHASGQRHAGLCMYRLRRVSMAVIRLARLLSACHTDGPVFQQRHCSRVDASWTAARRR